MMLLSQLNLVKKGWMAGHVTYSYCIFQGNNLFDRVFKTKNQRLHAWFREEFINK